MGAGFDAVLGCAGFVGLTSLEALAVFDEAGALTDGLVLAAGFVFTAGTLPTGVFAADVFKAPFEDAGFDTADFEPAAFVFADLEPVWGDAEDLPDLPDIALITPCAEVTFKYMTFGLLNQALL